MSLARFDEIADLFDQVTETPIHRRMRRSIRFPLGAIQGARILDLGAGPGGLTSDLAAEGATVIAVDGAPEMLDRARRRLRRAPASAARLVRADAGRLPLPARSVDHAVGMLILHLLEDPLRSLEELRRVVRPGGRLVFLTQSNGFREGAEARLREPMDPLERRFLDGCARSAAAHPLRSREEWQLVFRRASLPEPTISSVLPEVVWLLFTCLPDE